MVTCLVTGGAGNLACQLTWALADRFDRVVLLDVAARPVGPTASDACFERGNLLDGPGSTPSSHGTRPPLSSIWRRCCPEAASGTAGSPGE